MKNFKKNHEPNAKHRRNVFGESLSFLSAMIGATMALGRPITGPVIEPAPGDSPRHRVHYSGKDSGSFNPARGSRAERKAKAWRRSMHVNGRSIGTRPIRRQGEGKFHLEFYLR